jgi:predicted ATP-dependent serine protease
MNTPAPKKITSMQIGALSHLTLAEQKEWQEHPELHRPVRTNITKLDRAIGGFLEGSYVVIGGKWKSGKTTVAQHIATVLGVAKRGKVKYYLLEELKRQMAIRSMTRLTPAITRSDFRNVVLTEDNLAELEKAAKMLDAVDMEIDDGLNKMRMIIDDAIANKVTWAVVDYFQLLTDAIGRQENERLDAVSRMIMEARNKFGITFIVIYQLNDRGKAHGTRSLYRDADMILEIKAGEEENTEEEIPGSMFIDVLPGRSCPGGAHVEISFSGAHSRIMDMPLFDAANLTTVEEALVHNEDLVQDNLIQEEML